MRSATPSSTSLPGTHVLEAQEACSPGQDLLPTPEHLQLALETSGIGLWTLDLATHAVWWSVNCHRIHGLAPDEVPLTAAEFFEWVHPDDRAWVRQAVDDAVAARSLYEAEFRIVRPAGEIVWVANRGTAVYGPDGTALSVMGTIMDITSRRRVDEAERQTRAVYDALANELPGGAAFIVDRTLRYTLAAGQALAAMGRSAADFEGATVSEMLPPDLARVAIADYRRVLDGGTFRREHVIGERVFVTQGLPLRHANGDIHSALAVSFDVTDRAGMERSLRARERELQTLADNLPDLVSRLDRQCRHVLVNRAAERVTGRPVEALVNRSWREWGLPDELCTRWEQTVALVFQNSKPASLDFEMQTPEGRRYFHGRIAPEIGPDGTVHHVLAILSDVTAHRAAENALVAAGRRKDEFLATLAHELRNPLAPIGNGVAILRRESAISAMGTKALNIMDRQLAHVSRLVDDLMDAARIGQGKITLECRAVVLQSVVESAVELARLGLDAAGHRLVLALPEGPIYLYADATRITQIIGNLLNNAAKYTPGGGLVQLTALREGTEAVIRITDTGVGIPAHMLGEIFDLFTQVHEHRGHAQGGLGIGLSVARRLAEMHGGRLKVQSPGVGQGSTFILRLPMLMDHDATPG